MSSVRIDKESLDSPAAVSLISALNAELMQRYPEDGATHFRLDSAEVAPGHGAFLVALLGDEPVGCGAVRRLNDGEAEVKRMYVAPTVRGRGVGGALLAAIEEEARLLGIVRLVLETGERQPEALALYRRFGFVNIPPFGEYIGSPLSVCMAKDLD